MSKAYFLNELLITHVCVYRGMPRRLGHMLSRRHFAKPQYENFWRIMLGLMVAGEGGA